MIHIGTGVNSVEDLRFVSTINTTLRLYPLTLFTNKIWTIPQKLTPNLDSRRIQMPSYLPNRRLVLCKKMLQMPFHYFNLHPSLWELIWSYLNDYRDRWNAVNLEYRSVITRSALPIPRYEYTREALIAIQNQLRIYDRPLKRLSYMYRDRTWIYLDRRVDTIRIRGNRPPWYWRRICYNGTEIQSFRTLRNRGNDMGIRCYRSSDPRVTTSVPGSRERLPYCVIDNINSPAGRVLIREHQLGSFFEKFILPVGLPEWEVSLNDEIQGLIQSARDVAP